MRIETLGAGLTALALVACTEAPVGRVPRPPCPDRMVLLPELEACIDRFEASTEMDRDRLTAVSSEGRLPRTEITWADAQRACRNAGHRLCSDQEFDLACGGAVEGGRVYPYGDEFEPERCNVTPDRTPTTVRRLDPGGARSGCVTPLGIHDLSGNVIEWLSTWDPNRTRRATRGGHYATYPRYATCRTDPPSFDPPDFASNVLGFRCCADALGTTTSN